MSAEQMTFDAPDCLVTDVVAEEFELRIAEPEQAEATAEPSPAVTTATEVSGDPLTGLPPAEFEWPVESRSNADNLLDEIWNAEQECRRKESHVEYLKEQIKEAKASLEQTVISLRRLCSENDRERPISHTSVSASHEEPAKALTATATAELEVESTAATAPDESWRAVPLAELLATPIKKLGPKKIEALTDLCPTLGDFENLRTRVGRDATEFHELLPKGIGLETASELEERFLNWIAKNASGGNGKPESNLLTRATEINTGSINCLDHKHPEGKQWHESGWQAWSREVKLEECPYVPGPEQDDWIRGWLSHELIERYSETQGEEDETKAAGGETTAVSLDDL